MARQDPVVVVPSAARTTSGSASFQVPRGSENSDTTEVALLLNVTAVSGTAPNMAMAIEWSHDGTTYAPPETAETFTAVIAVAQKVKSFQKRGPFCRFAWTITGTTPSFTFSVSAYGV